MPSFPDETVTGSGVGRYEPLARRYALALCDAERDAAQAERDALRGDVARWRSMVRDIPDVRRILANPAISAAELSDAVDALVRAAGFGRLFGNFLRTVAARRRTVALSEMLRRHAELSAVASGKTVASVTSARPLPDERTEAIKAALEDASGRTVIVETRVDETLLGGLVVRIGGRVMDGSLRGRLHALERTMNGVS